MVKKKFPLIRILLGIAAIWFLRPYISIPSWAEDSTPAKDLKEAISLIESKRYTKAIDTLDKALKDQHLAHWATLKKAIALKGLNKPKEAVSLLKNIPRDNAAWPEALIELLELREYCPDLVIGQEIVRIIALAPEIGRRDLLPTLYLGQAREAIRAKQLGLAKTIISNIRKSYPNSKYAKLARAELKHLESISDTTISSPAELVAESNILLLSRSYDEALETLYNARIELPKDSVAYGETLLLEEKILKSQKRHVEADHILSKAAHFNDSEIASQALFRSAQNAWNINKHQLALSLIETIKKSYKKSSILSSAMYVEARVLEEMNLVPEAKETYCELAKQTKDTLFKLKAMLRLGFIDMRLKNYSQAATSFHNTSKLAEVKLGLQEEEENNQQEATNSKNTPIKTLPLLEVSKRELRAHLLAALYWEAKALEKRGSESTPSLKYKPQNPIDIYKRLKTLDATGYYGFKASKHLPVSAKPSDATSVINFSGCMMPVEKYLIELASSLKDAELEALAQKELNWYFAIEATKTFNKNEKKPSKDPNTMAVAWAHLSNVFGETKKGIRVSSKYLRSFQNQSCKAALVELSHPIEFSHLIKQASKDYNVPSSLILAITRTESHFDKDAVSSVGALGLMQLMPKTATKLGHSKEDDIFNPETNINLGTKYLKELLSRYENNIVYTAAAYNAGQGPVERWRKRHKDIDIELWIEFIGYPETKEYVKKVIAAKHHYETKPTPHSSKPLWNFKTLKGA